jgi:hypothetical protein
MTGITVATVVDVISNTTMLAVHLCLDMGMTIGTAEDRIILGISVTIVTGCPFALMGP